jgi:hypothetical protein
MTGLDLLFVIVLLLWMACLATWLRLYSTAQREERHE